MIAVIFPVATPDLDSYAAGKVIQTKICRMLINLTAVLQMTVHPLMRNLVRTLSFANELVFWGSQVLYHI